MNGPFWEGMNRYTALRGHLDIAMGQAQVRHDDVWMGITPEEEPSYYRR